MAKKSKSSVKGESKASEEETRASDEEFKIPTPKGGIIDFYLLFGGIAILVAISMIIYLLNNYVFHFL